MRPSRWAVVAAAAVATVVALPVAHNAGAAFSDAVPVTTGEVSAAPAPGPVTGMSCSTGLLTITFSWNAQTYRDYRIRVVDRVSGAVYLPQTITSNSFTIGATLLGGGQFRFEVIAGVPGSTWQSTVVTTNFTQAVLGLAFSCT